MSAERTVAIPGEVGIRRGERSGRIRGGFELAGKFHGKWFAPAVDLAIVRAWIVAERDALLRARVAVIQARAEYGDAPAAARGRPVTVGRGADLTADVHRFLPQIAGRPSAAADASPLRAWLAVELTMAGRVVRLADLPRPAITLEHINLTIAQWRSKPSRHTIRRVRVTAHDRHGSAMPAYERAAPATSGAVVSDRTIRHRCRMYAELCRGLDGAKAATPIDDANVPAVPKTHPIGVPTSIVLAVALELAKAAIPRSPVRKFRETPAYWAREQARAKDCLQTYARYVVLATTGQRPIQVARAQPIDLNLDAGTWVVRAAKNEPAHTITLTADMVNAWQAFIAADPRFKFIAPFVLLGQIFTGVVIALFTRHARP